MLALIEFGLERGGNSCIKNLRINYGKRLK